MLLAQKACFETRRYACVVRHSPFSVRPLSVTVLMALSATATPSGCTQRR